MTQPPPPPTLFPYTTLFRSCPQVKQADVGVQPLAAVFEVIGGRACDADDAAEGVVLVRVGDGPRHRSEEHTSELQSHHDLVCRLLLEKKKKKTHTINHISYH